MCEYKSFYCYPAVVEKTSGEFGVFFPNFDGCVTGGANPEEIIKNAREALSLHLYGMEQDGETPPEAAYPKDVRLSDNQYLIMVDINYGYFREKMDKKSINRVVTLPRYLNAAAGAYGINVSQLLQEALKQKLGI